MGRDVRLDRFGMGLLALALTAGPVVAQEAPPVTNNSASRPAVIGTPISDFNLNGTVTRQAAPPATATPPPTARTEPAATAEPARQAARSAREAPTQPPPAQADSTATADASPSPTPTTSLPSAQVGQPAVDSVPVPPIAALPATVLPGEPGSGPAYWPWLLAALAAASAGLLLFRRRQQQSEGFAAAGAGLAFDPSPGAVATAEPLRRAPVAPPVTPKPASTGIVSTKLHPDLNIDLLPERAIVDDQGATIEFQVAVRNHGSAPARDVHVEACMVNAGPSQDQELGAFFAHPTAASEPIPQIMPMTEIMLKSAVRLKLDQMRQFEVGGRKLFVPLVGVNAVYRGPGGPAQTSASYLVGRDGKGDKMAPFRLDLGPRIFRGLGARQHSLGLRK